MSAAFTLKITLPPAWRKGKKTRYGRKKNTEIYSPQRMWRLSTGDIIYLNNGCSFHRKGIMSVFFRDF